VGTPLAKISIKIRELLQKNDVTTPL